VPLQDPLHDRQADAGARIFAGFVQTLEDPEQLVDVLHIEADAVVAHVVDGGPPVRRQRAYLNSCLRAPAVYLMEFESRLT